MYESLMRAYGPQYWWPARTRFEVVVGAYLTQNTSWRTVEISLRNLRNAGALTVQGLRSISIDSLKALIRPSGFHSRKAPALKAFVAMLDDEFQGSLDRLAAPPGAVIRLRLLALPGVGPETADAILLYALGHPVPVADEYLRRIALRHHLIDPPPGKNRKGYEAMLQLIKNAFQSDPESEHRILLNEFHALTVAVGKEHCGRIPNCKGCPLADDLRNIQTTVVGSD